MEVACHWVIRVDATGRLYCFTMLLKEKTPQDQEWFVIILLCFDVFVTTFIRSVIGVKEHQKKNFCTFFMMYHYWHNFYYFVSVDFIQSVKEFHVKLIYQLCTFSLLSHFEKSSNTSIHSNMYFLSFITDLMSIMGFSDLDIDYVELSQTERLQVIIIN